MHNSEFINPLDILPHLLWNGEPYQLLSSSLFTLPTWTMCFSRAPVKIERRCFKSKFFVALLAASCQLLLPVLWAVTHYILLVVSGFWSVLLLSPDWDFTKTIIMLLSLMAFYRELLFMWSWCFEGIGWVQHCFFSSMNCIFGKYRCSSDSFKKVCLSYMLAF